MKCASVTVTYGPDREILAAQLDSLPSDWIRVIIDNGSSGDSWQATTNDLKNRDDVVLINMHRNVGLGAAQNAGIKWLSENTDCTHVLLLDQDSEPRTGAALRLLEAYQSLQAQGSNIGAVGPTLIDPISGVSHGFHIIDGWRWRRRAGKSGEYIRCAGINGSGTFMAISVATDLGGMDETLFIDLVDAEWSFRLANNGYALRGVPDAIFEHRMGEITKRIWLLGWNAWPVRTPMRHRYLFRNYFILLRRDYVPAVWKFWAVAKLILTFLVFSVTGPHRASQMKQMLKGTADGLQGRTGPLH